MSWFKKPVVVAENPKLARHVDAPSYMHPASRAAVAGWRMNADSLDAVARDLEAAGVSSTNTSAAAYGLRILANNFERAEQTRPADG